MACRYLQMRKLIEVCSPISFGLDYIYFLETYEAAFLC